MGKFYVITYYNTDPYCDNVIECANGGLYSKKLYESAQEAFAALKKSVEEDAKFQNSENGSYPEEEGYSYEISELNGWLKEVPDVCVDWYDSDAECIFSETCQVEEVEL